MNIKKVTVFEAQMKELGLARVYEIKENRFGSPHLETFPLRGHNLQAETGSRVEKKRVEVHVPAYKKEEFTGETLTDRKQRKSDS